MEQTIKDIIEDTLVSAGFEVIDGEDNSLLVLPAEGKDNFIVNVGMSV